MRRIRVLGLTTTGWRSFYEAQEAALAEAGITCITRDVPGDHRAFHDGVRERSVLDYLRLYPTVLREVPRCDLVHANYGLTAPFALAQPRPSVLTLWGGEFVANPYASLIGACTRRVDEVIVPSAALAERLPDGVEPHVIPFPVDTDLFRPVDTRSARERVGWDADGRIVLFPYATSRFEKNYPLAERVVDGLDVDAELRTVANRPHEEMPYYLNASDAVLVTSRWESGPMVVKEALACEVPVVARPVGFAPSVLDGVDGCRIGRTERELRSALSTVLRAGGRADGRDRVLEYGAAEMGEHLRTVYERCL